MSKIIIIGGGISGMAAAFRLKHDHGLDSIVLESADRPGGKAQTEYIEGFTCEHGTNSWIDKEPAAKELLSDLGISDRIQPADEAAERRFIFRAGGLREIHLHPLKFMLSSVLPLGARLRLAIEPLTKKRTDGAEETLAEFAARRLGKGARDILISPMASGVYAGDPAQLSVRSCFPKVCALEERYGSLIKGMNALKREKKRAGEDPSTVQAGPSGRLTSLKGGVSDLVRALADNLEKSLQFGRKVTSVSTGRDSGFTVHLGSGESIHADAVVSAAPAWAAASYLETLDGEASRAFADVHYPALDVVCLGFRAKQVGGDLDGFGFLVPRGQDKTILGSLYTSSIFPGRAPDGCVLIRSMIGGMLEPQVAGWTKDQVIDTIRRELEDILDIPQSEEPVFQRIYRHERAIPQYHVGHEALVARIRQAEDRYPGLFTGGNAVGGIGVIDCIREASPIAQRVADFLKQRSNPSK